MALASPNLPNFIVHDTISVSDHYSHDDQGGQPNLWFEKNVGDHQDAHGSPHFYGLDFHVNLGLRRSSSSIMLGQLESSESAHWRMNIPPTQGRKKRRRRARICKDKEEAEAQRITHIFVERNRRKLMNEHLAVLRSLMPDHYAQRGDQASIVGGAINFVKELEQLQQSLEAQKRILLQQSGRCKVTQDDHDHDHDNNNNNNPNLVHPFETLSSYPRCSWAKAHHPQQLENGPAMADVEVTVFEAHANLRILSKRRPKQLTKMIVGFQALHLTILHLNVTTLDPFLFYSISAKVEDGCRLKSVDDIEGAVHHILTVAEEEASLS